MTNRIFSDARRALIRAGAALTAVTWTAGAPAQSVEEFYKDKGKLVSIVVYTTTGSGYDLSARVLARHMPHHLPGSPNIIVRNMPGAGGLTATRSPQVMAISALPAKINARLRPVKRSFVIAVPLSA